MPTSKEIGKTLKRLRGGKTVEEVAKACNISASALSMYENGYRVPKDKVKIKLAKYFGTSVGSIFFNE
jgi:transcriptional regulator with XRE-family HTH domain